MTAQAKAYKGLGMEGPIATWYAKNTRDDRRRFETVAQTIADRTPAGSSVLEVAPGPGYLAVEMARSGRHVSAVDISRSFVKITAENAAKAGVEVDVRHGDAAALPFGADCFDYVVCMAAFKNFSNPVGALNEIHRVLKPGAQASIYDLRREARMEDIEREVLEMHLSKWNAWMTRGAFRFLLLKRAYSRKEMERMAAQSRFGWGEVAAEGIGFELRLKKV